MAVKKRAAKKTVAKKTAAKKNAAKKPMVKARADFGQPVDAFFAKQSAALAPLTNALRALVKKIAPDATGSLKWGMPFYEIEGRPVCAIGAHKAHVNFILSGPASLFDDPDGLPRSRQNRASSQADVARRLAQDASHALAFRGCGERPTVALDSFATKTFRAFNLDRTLVALC